MRDWKNPGGDRGCCTTRRAARGMREIPGITGRAEQTRLRGRHQSEFRTGGFAEDRKTGIEEAAGQGAVMVRHVRLEQARARGRDGARQRLEVLEQERHAGEGTARKATFDLFARIVVVPDDDSVDLRIDFFRPRDRLVQQLLCADLLVANERREAETVVVAVFLECHGGLGAPCDEIERPATARIVGIRRGG